MAKSNLNTGISVGSSSILVVFVVLCLTTFATLSLASANADYKLTRRTADEAAAYYAADAKAEDILMQIDQSFALCYATAQVYDEYQKPLSTTIRDKVADFFGETLKTGNKWIDSLFGAVSDFIEADPKKGGEDAPKPFPYSDILPEGLSFRQAYSVLLKHLLEKEIEGLTISKLEENFISPVVILDYEVPISESRVLRISIDASDCYGKAEGKLRPVSWSVVPAKEWEEPQMPGLLTGLPDILGGNPTV